MKYDNNKTNDGHIGSEASMQGHHLYRGGGQATSLNKLSFPRTSGRWEDQNSHRCNLSEKGSNIYRFHNKNTSGKR